MQPVSAPRQRENRWHDDGGQGSKSLVARVTQHWHHTNMADIQDVDKGGVLPDGSAHFFLRVYSRTHPEGYG